MSILANTLVIKEELGFSATKSPKKLLASKEVVFSSTIPYSSFFLFYTCVIIQSDSDKNRQRITHCTIVCSMPALGTTHV